MKGYIVLVAMALLTSGVAQAEEPPIKITTVVKNEQHPQFGKGAPAGYAVDGQQNKSIVLERGKTYTFDVDTGVAHDFYLSTQPKGWGSDTLTEGVEGNYTYKGSVTFKPSDKTPDTVYLACRNHKFMGGEVKVVNKK